MGFVCTIAVPRELKKIALAILVLYVCILKAVTVFKEFLHCLAGKKAYLFRAALQCAEDGETSANV